MSQLQLIGSYEVYSNGSNQGLYDLRIESLDPSGSIETLIQGANVTTTPIPSGLLPEMTMDREQAFEAIRFTQDRTKALAEAFGSDIPPRPQGFQVQGVAALLRPKWIDVVGCGCSESPSSPQSGYSSVAKVAFIVRDEWLTVSIQDADGNWHSDSEKLGGAFGGLTATQLAAVIGKILAAVQLSWWMWALIAVCAVVTGGAGAVLCALALIALELITIVMIIAIIEEVTGQSYTSVALNTAKSQYDAHQFGSVQASLVTARSDMNDELGAGFPHPDLGLFLQGVLPPS